MQNELDLTIHGIDFVVERRYTPHDGYEVLGRTSCRFVYNIEGNATLRFADRELKTGAGDILLMSPENDHNVSVGENGYHFITVSFSIPGQSLPRSLFPVAFLADGSLAYLFPAMYRAYEMRETGWQLEIKGAIYTLLSRLCADRLREESEGGKIRDTVAYIKTHYSKKLTLAELARVSGYSVPHFKTLFREEMGCSPIAYLNRIRIGRATDLLRSGMFSVSETADACGFENVYYFSNVFKKLTGITPGRCRGEKGNKKGGAKPLKDRDQRGCCT